MQNMTEQIPICGLTYIRDYIDAEAATSLLTRIDSETWSTDLTRRMQHYGYRYDYKARRIATSDYLGPLPDWLGFLGRGLVESGFFPTPPDQAIVNEYQPGQGIAAHIDCVPCFGEEIASLSLGAASMMEFSNPSNGVLRHELKLEPQSLLIFIEDARYHWRHSIRPRKSDRVDGILVPRNRRVSVTFRKVLMN